MLDKVKLALRITATAFDSELNILISACQADLGLSGISYDDTKELIQTAVIFYCKANFGNFENAERWQQAYNNLKCVLKISSDYAVTDDE